MAQTVDNTLIERLAKLAKLSFNPEEKEKIKGDLSRILQLVEQLNEVDTAGVEPLIYLSDEWNNLRPDIRKSEITRDEALKNAPDHDSDFFKVPKVVQNTD